MNQPAVGVMVMATDSGDASDNEYTQHERLAEISESPGFQEKLSELFLPLYHRFYSPGDDFVVKTNQKLAKARVDDTAEMYISRSLGYGVLTGLVLWLVVTLSVFLFVVLTGFEVGPLLGVQIEDDALLEFVHAVRTPAVILFLGIIFGSIGFLGGFYAPHINLGMQASARKREIDMLLPDTVSYMYALSIGGMNQLEIIESVADSEDVYGEASKEFQSIIQETEYFDVDYRTAIRHRAEETPSENLAQFLTDMLSILSSGGDLTSFLDDKTDKQLRMAKEDQKDLIEMLELFGEMYLNLSLLPLLLLILITIMQLMGGASAMMLYMVIYIVIPFLGVGFLVLMSTVLPDEPGDGRLDMGDRGRATTYSILDFTTTKQYKGLTPRFDQIYSKEFLHRTKEILRAPHILFIERPLLTLLFTVPIALIIVIAGFLTGIAPRSLDGLFSGLWGTFYYMYIPMYLVLIPLTVFTVLHNRRRSAITSNYTEGLRKLSSANDTGQTLLESFMTVADTSTGRLADEFRAINAKVDYNYSVRQAIVEFNNKYRVPELARINNLIIDAQETSSNISDVLVTAAQTSENQDDLKRERASRTRMQIVMVLMTFVVLMGVIAALQDQFIGTMGEVAADMEEGGAADQGGAMDFDAIDPTRTGVLYFHAITIQAITAGLLCSYLRSNSLKQAGLFILPMATLALFVWIAIM